ncbi:hypothetical protein DL96DRAFT_1433190, partial [Flagelloscypha sp. PMI_526]
CAQHGRHHMYDTEFSYLDGPDLKEHATEWRDCMDAKKRARIFNEYGVRWSEFWRLPYWNPARMLVVDPMHAVLEGVAHYYSRHVLELNYTARTGDDVEKAACFTHPWPEYDSTCHPALVVPEHKRDVFENGFPRWLTTPIEGDGSILRDVIHKRIADGTTLPMLRHFAWVMNLNLPLVQAINRHLETSQGADYSGIMLQHIEGDCTRKDDYIRAILDWRMEKPRSLPDTTNSHQANPLAALTAVRSVISDAAKPSHLTTVPANFGHANAGSIKAAEWRLLSTVYIPIALCILWNDADGSSPSEKAAALARLDHAMALFQA